MKITFSPLASNAWANRFHIPVNDAAVLNCAENFSPDQLQSLQQATIFRMMTIRCQDYSFVPSMISLVPLALR